MSKTKSAFIAIVGRPNVGKSSIINKLLGQKIAIVSDKPQTTRTRIMGVVTKDVNQFVFVDTPGYHKSANKIDDVMDSQIAEAMEDTEIVLMMISAKKSLVEQFERLYKKVGNNARKILLINKID